MKTAMQELIEHIESNEIVYNKDLILKLKELLEKEKDQIIDAYRIAAINNTDTENWSNLDNEYFEISANQYFDKHFNQNK